MFFVSCRSLRSVWTRRWWLSFRRSLWLYVRAGGCEGGYVLVWLLDVDVCLGITKTRLGLLLSYVFVCCWILRRLEVGNGVVGASAGSGVLWWGGSILMALFWCVMVCCGGLGLFCSYSWKLLHVGLVVGGTWLIGFGFGKTATLLVCWLFLRLFNLSMFQLHSCFCALVSACVGWRFLFRRGCLISECEWILLNFGLLFCLRCNWK
jgi:hypothetical protein